MDNTPFEDDWKLKQVEARCQAYLDSNKAAMSFSQSALKSALLLNGMGAVAVLYSPQIKLHLMTCTLVYFAVGALCAAIAYGLAYIAQFLIMMTWHHNLYVDPGLNKSALQKLNQRIRRISFCGNFVRALTMIVVICSYAAFSLLLCQFINVG